MKFANGNTAEWDFIHHDGAAAVLPVTEDGKILMVRQYRNALDRYTLEIPAGKLDSPDEAKIDCAYRELEEETGYRCDHLEYLMSVNTTIAFCDEALDIFIQNVKPVISYAEKMGVIFAIEPVWKHIVCNPKRARKVLDEIASPNLQIIFDPVNLLDISNYQNRDAIIEEAIELLGDDIAMVHMKDFVVQDGKLVSVAAGTGEMNYEKIIRFIKERKPYIHVTLENTTPENAVQSKEYIQGLYDSCRI